MTARNIPASAATPLRLLRLPDVLQQTGLSKTQLYGLQRAGQFPASVQLHGRAVAWYAHEIHTWQASRPRRGGPRHENAPAVAAEASNCGSGSSLDPR